MPHGVASLAVAALFVQLGSACHPRPTTGPIAVPPIGLDSTATARWVADQRASCPGSLIFAFNEDMIERKGTNSAVVFRYEKSFAGVQCIRPR